MSDTHVAVEGDLVTVTIDLTKEIGPQVQHLREAADAARQQWEESEWYLGEARTALARTEAELAEVGQVYHQLQERNHALTVELEEVGRQRDEANWYLSETRAGQDELRAQVEALSHQLVQTQDALDALLRVDQEADERVLRERARCQALERELAAVRAHGERRHTSRLYRSDIRVELQDPDGTLIFDGAPRNVSSTGVGIASAQPMGDLPDLVQVRLHFSTLDRPIEAIGRPAWQVQNGNHLVGCQLLDVPSGCLDTLERTLTTA